VTINATLANMANFNVQGQWMKWTAIQTNGVARFNIQAQRPDGLIIGTASQDNGVVGAGFGSVLNGQFVFRIKWTNGSEGLYSGVLDRERVLRGSTFDLAHPGSVAGWFSNRAF
jgi:hypothetical protein